ncbi:hypothetical protein DUT67_10755 [Pectobacterium peruviense]|uniref:hypothetical protein n=1 Tax=Pectobacterium peruviense TaxID=2066479 RepID=UPI001CB962B8|nr:hypothetical protein [Pectobacterium peruviense]
MSRFIIDPATADRVAPACGVYRHSQSETDDGGKMAIYMTQQMSNPKTITITYYRKQSSEHVSHDESGRFTKDAVDNYAKFNNLRTEEVVKGNYKSGQGVPVGGKVFQI